MTEAGCVHIVDDDPAVRDSLEFLLAAAGFEIRAYASATEFLEATGTSGPGCILTDIRMPDIDGLTLQKRLVESGSSLPVVIMTGHGDVPLAVEALKNGAVDFLEKPFDDAHLIEVLHQALATGAKAHAADAARKQVAARLLTLTPREHDVLTRLVAGHANKSIAIELGTSPRTVEVQRARVMEKMGARSLPELVRMVLDAGDVQKSTSG